MSLGLYLDLHAPAARSSVTSSQTRQEFEAAIKAEESRPGEAVERWNQVFILGARRANFNADDQKSNPSLTQKLLLAVGQIFVEHQH